MVFVRAMVVDDVEQVAALEQENPSPWSQQILEQELLQYRKKKAVQKIFLVAEKEKGIIGWLCASGIAPEVDLEKIAVAIRWRKNGVAGQLFGVMLTLLQNHLYSKIFLEVREQNRPARLFYQKHGFVQIGKRTLYYDNPKDNALILSKSIGQQGKENENDI